jgi:hypothetical protein
MRELLVIALVLACPLMMLLMMRSHRHGGGDGPREVTTNDLRRRRDELDRQIEEREQFDPAQPEREPTHTR